MSLGNIINHYRQQCGLTQEQLAAQMNVTRQTVSNWERGINEPDFDSLCRLAGVFGITLNDFAEGITSSKDADDADEESACDERGAMGLKQATAGMLDGAALFIGVLIFFLGGFLFGGWKGWLGSFIAGGCIFLAISSVLRAIAAMKG